MSYVITRAADAGAAYMPIWAPLLAFNHNTVGDADGVPFALTITAGDDPAVHGGLWALSLWGSFYIALVVVPADARHHGLGRELMRQAEAEALARGCRQMWLDTYAFQARAFYEQLGFAVFGQIEGPAPMFPRYFMQKLLNAA
ncbi:MAG TPA: GNAT family N-acetyltransferase [Rhizomicrobium sp.]|jgi:GNAT superfamily N-acetyltransferase|nr:GNAT family N-acetyltransferase [Rhizomicrobium sp.]